MTRRPSSEGPAVNLQRWTPATHLRRAAGAAERVRAQEILDGLLLDEPAVCAARLFLLAHEVDQCTHKAETVVRGHTRARRT